jgi:hypothetical protein
VFGIGRDDASSLYQRQSASVEDTTLAVAVNDFAPDRLNSSNTGTLADNSYLLFGSNGLTGRRTFTRQKNTAGYSTALGGTAVQTLEINFISSTIWKAQTTISNVQSGSQMTGIRFKVSDNTIRYVVVTTDPTNLTPANSRIYPVNETTLTTGLLGVNNGEYVLLAGFSSAPGGAINNTYQAWLVADDYNSSTGVWPNRIVGGASVGNFSPPQNKPTKNNSGRNFHSEVVFSNTGDGVAYGRQRLASQYNISVASTENASQFLVIRQTVRESYDNIINYDNSWHKADIFTKSNGNLYTAGHGSTTDANDRELGAWENGLLAVDNDNLMAASGNHIDVYKNGAKSSYLQTTTNGNFAASGYKAQIACGLERTNGYYGFDGAIQEVILLKAPGTNSHIAATDITKIQSYLAIKYGITLNNTDNYVNSFNNTVYPYDATYNKKIFGIGRDDASGLNQKQSVSSDQGALTAYIGPSLRELNSQNTGTFATDTIFAVFGSNGQTGLASRNIAPGTAFANGTSIALTSPALTYVSNIIYKAVVTGVSSLTLTLKCSSEDHLYCFVADNPADLANATFNPAGITAYPISDKLVQLTLPAGTKYISFGGMSSGPGGVLNCLLLWLRADNEESLTLNDLPVTDAKLSNYNTVTGKTATSYPAVAEWVDPIRGHKWSWAAGDNAAAHRIPVYESSSPVANFQPAVRFWGSGNTYGSYLANASNLAANPANHIAYFVVNNDFGTNDWVYPMMFGTATSNAIYYGPGYGVQKSGSIMVGRFRTANTQVQGSANLFKPGATSVLRYDVTSSSSPGNVSFHFNGIDDPSTYSFTYAATYGLNHESQLGKGYTYDRTIQGVLAEVIFYNCTMTQTEKDQVESYIAIKYGITLAQSGSKHDYVLSDGAELWTAVNPPAGRPYNNYYNNVAAVIRDDASHLHNRQAMSSGSGSIMHMGVAGSKLTKDGASGDLGDLLYDKEAVVWGDNGLTGATAKLASECGPFEERYNRLWMVHKVTNNNRPISMLVAAQNNTDNPLGSNMTASDIPITYINMTGSYDFYMIVAETEADYNAHNYKAVVPMTYVDGLHQCNYTFTDEICFVTFAYKQSPSACHSEVEWQGTKTFDWRQWSSPLNTNTNPGTLSRGEQDLGDGVSVTASYVKFDAGVSTMSLYPRNVGTPSANSLQIMRRGGTLNTSKVTTAVKFNTPLLPSFIVADLDGELSSYDNVRVVGYCGTQPVMPQLKYVGPPLKTPTTAAMSSYKISGNEATVTRNVAYAPTDARGQVQVDFAYAIDSLEIIFTVANRIVSATAWKQLNISPIKVKMMPPPMKINEDGLGFAKEVDLSECTTCDRVKYTFTLLNVNCDDKYVTLTDKLPQDLRWSDADLILDTITSLHNPTLVMNSYAHSGTLELQNLLVPGQDTIIISAYAEFDPGVAQFYDPVSYCNVNDPPTQIAQISYDVLRASVMTHVEEGSLDRYTLDPATCFTAEWRQRLDTVRISSSVTPEQYRPNTIIEVSIDINNPNDPVPDTYLLLNWDAGFTYVAGSLATTPAIAGLQAVSISPSPTDSMLYVAGNAAGDEGFELPTGHTIVKFKLQSPLLLTDCRDGYLDDGVTPTGTKTDLTVSYEVSTGVDDPCVLETMTMLSGTQKVPFQASKKYIILNKHLAF